MMRRLIIVLLACFYAPSSTALNINDAYKGPPDCRVFNPDPIEHESVTWSEMCKDGYAEGPGILIWYKNQKENSRFEGPMVRGHPEGFDASQYPDGLVYEGQYHDGLRHEKK